MERESRREEALAVYRPRPNQLPFHQSDAYFRILRGGNRSGKTVAAAVEVASAVTGKQLYTWDGEPIEFRYPRAEPLTVWCIGFDENHLARMYRKLFEPGLFRTIRDETTGKMRAWAPWEEADAARRDETKPAPPLIPRRLCDPKSDIAWDSKGKEEPVVATLKNKTKLFFFPSGSMPGQGDPIDLLWIDEDIKFARFLQEWESRLPDRNGRAIWSVWPHTANDALTSKSRMAEEQRHRDKPDVVEWKIRFSDNPYIDDEAKRITLESWANAGAAVVSSRDCGEFILDLVLVFPGFNSDAHCLPSRAGAPDRLEQFLAARDWQIPFDWTSYIALDPGHTCTACLFAAVPPPSEFGECVVVYDEIYGGGMGDPHILAPMIRERSAGRYFEAFIIDYRAGRQRGLGNSKPVVDLYSEAFAKAGLRSRTTGSGFAFGTDDVTARNIQVRGKLGPGESAGPKLRFIRSTTPGTQKEFSLYKKRVSKDDVKEQVVDQDNDAMDALGYLIAYNPQYVIPEDSDPHPNPIVRFAQDLEKSSKPAGSEYVWMGAGQPNRDYENEYVLMP